MFNHAPMLRLTCGRSAIVLSSLGFLAMACACGQQDSPPDVTTSPDDAPDELVVTLQAQGGTVPWVNKVAWSADGKHFASAGNDGVLQVWETTDWTRVHAAQWQNSLSPLAFVGDTVYVADETGWIDEYNPANSEVLKNWNSPSGRIFAIAHDVENKQILTGGYRGVLYVWDQEDGSEVARYPTTRGVIRSIVIDGNRDIALFGNNEGDVYMIDLAGGQNPSALQHDLPGLATGLALSPADEGLLAVGFTEVIGLFDVAENRYVGTTAEMNGKGSIHTIAFVGDGKYLLIGAQISRDLMVWNRDRNEIHKSVRAHRTGIKCGALSPDGSLFVTGGFDGQVKVWDVARLLDQDEAEETTEAGTWTEQTQHWECPEHEMMRFDEAGRCPMCAKTLVWVERVRTWRQFAAVFCLFHGLQPMDALMCTVCGRNTGWEVHAYATDDRIVDE